MKIEELILKYKEWFLKHKKTVYIFTFIALIILVFVYKTSNKEQATTTNINLKKTTKNESETEKFDYEDEIFNSETEAYYFNSIITNKIPVTGFSWLDNKIIYSTPQGIYEGGTNNIIFEGTISEIRWSNNFNALVKYQGFWNKLNYKDKVLEEIEINLSNPSISDNGDYILDYTDNILSVLKISDPKNSYKEIRLNEPIAKAFFSGDSNSIIIATNYGKITYLYRFDLELNNNYFYQTGDNFELNNINFTGDSCLLSIDNKLYLTDFNELRLISTFRFNSNIHANFIRKDLLIIEKYKDNLGREFDDIYISNNSNTYKIADSKQIINRLKIDTNFIFNKNKTIVSFIENNNKIWILSLRKNLYPTYTINGDLIFSELIPRGHQ